MTMTIMRTGRLLAGGFLLLVLAMTVQARDQSSSAVKTLQIGRGSIEWVDWRADGELIMVSTVNGAWLYTPDLQDAGHIPEARLARFSPDGRYIAGVDDTHTVRLWDAETFEPAKTFETWNKLHIVRQLAWSPDSRYLAIAGSMGVDEVDIWDMKGEYEFIPLYLNTADNIVWSPEGSYLAGIESRTGKVWVWSTEQRGITFYNTPSYPPDYGALLVWRSDSWLTRGNMVDTTIQTETWDIPLNAKIDVGEVGSSSQFTYSPDGVYLAAANISGGIVIDTLKDQIIFTGNVDKGGFGAGTVAWSPDGKLLAGGGSFYNFTDLASVWVADPYTGKIMRAFKDHHQCIRLIRWHPQMEALLSVGCGDDLIVHWLTGSDSAYRLLKHTTINGIMAWNDDGSRVATADMLGNIHIRDSHTGKSLKTLGHPDPVKKIIWQPHGDLLATRSDYGFYSMDGGMIRLWSTLDGNVLSNFDQDVRYYRDIDWSPDGSFLAGTGDSDRLHIWNVNDLSLSYVVSVIGNSSDLGVKWSQDGNSIALPFTSSGGDGGVYLYALPDGTQIFPESYAPNYDSTWNWTDDNHLLWLNWGSYADIGYAPPVLEPITGIDNWINIQHTLKGMVKPVTKGLLSPHGKYATGIAENGSGLTWDTASGDVVFSLGDVKNVFWSPDETMLAVQRTDQQMWILNADGTVLARLPDDLTGAPVVPDWSEIPAQSVVWSPDSQRLAHVFGGTVTVWDIVEGTK